MELEQALERIKELEADNKALEQEKTKLIGKRDELLGEVKSLKTKYSKFADYADQDLDIAALLEIKQKFEAGDDATKARYEQAYKTDKERLEARLRAIEEERQAEKEERERERTAAAAAALKADAIAEFSRESHRIRNPEQFYRLFGDKIQRGEDGKLYVGDEYKKQSLAEYVAQINEDEENAHHFKPRGGTGSGTTAGQGGAGKVTVNPFKKGPSWNLTKQGQLTKENPELAARLKAEAQAGQ